MRARSGTAGSLRPRAGRGRASLAHQGAVPKDGFCKICNHPEAHRFVKGAREGGKKGTGWNATEAIEAGEAYGLKFTRLTWYNHVAHLSSAEERIATAAKSASRAGLVPVKTTNAQFLEHIRDIGMARAMQDPDSVSLDQALKAAQILETKKEKGQDSLAILVSFTIGAPPPVVVEGQLPDGIIEGEAREID